MVEVLINEVPEKHPRIGLCVHYYQPVLPSRRAILVPSVNFFLLTDRSSKTGCPEKALSGPHIARYCDTIAAIPHVVRYFFSEVSSSPRWCDTPPWRFVSHRHMSSAISHFATYRAKLVRYPPTPHKNKHERVLQYYRYKS